MKRNLRAAFTLIELLVVITIIAILASFALPAYTTVQERANQTKDLSNAKQVGLALKQLAADNNGSFPSKQRSADYSSAVALTGANFSNDALWWLFPNYLQSEDIFVVPGSAWTPNNPDNKLDASNAAARVFTLAQGEDGYAYITNLVDTSNPAFPLVADGFSAVIPNYATSKSIKGGAWSGRKAIVLFCDASAQIMKINDTTNVTVKRPGHAYSLFSNGNNVPADPWLDATNLVLNPL